MNIKVTSETNDYLNGNIQFIAEIFENENENPSIIFRKDESGKIGIHLSNWNCAESVDVYSANDVLELLEALTNAKVFLVNLLQEMNDDQMNLFENTKQIKQITID
jgi:phosphoribosyl 1,2-cyclic phosphodiesterase